MGVRNHPGGRLGPLEVIFDLFGKIDFRDFFGIFPDFPIFLVRWSWFANFRFGPGRPP